MPGRTYGEATCPICGAVFQKRKSNQLCCSDRCRREKFWRPRRETLKGFRPPAIPESALALISTYARHLPGCPKDGRQYANSITYCSCGLEDRLTAFENDKAAYSRAAQAAEGGAA